MLWFILTALAAEPTLPSLVRDVAPVYPSAALELGLGGTVLLELDVDAAGAVADVRVVEGSGDEGLDAAAVSAALGFGFTPARDATGAEVPATIRYRTVFEPEQAAALSAEGRVREAGTRQPLSDALVTLTGGGNTWPQRTDGDGRVAWAGLDDGAYSVTIEAPGFGAQTAELDVAAGRVASLDVALVRTRPWEVETDEDIVVVGRRTEPEVTERVLSSEEIRYLPGTGGDVVRVVQNLPGVARPPLNIGQLLIRGTAPEDSAAYLDGARIPAIFHFSGLSTVINGDAVDEVSLLPGSYGVRYGRTLGGLVDLRLGRDLPERSSGYVSVDVLQTTAFVEQRLSSRDALQLSGRRSYIDAVLNPILSGAGDAAVQAPRFYDLQVRWLRTTSGGSIDAMLLLSDDRFRVVGADADDVEQVQIGLTESFAKLRLMSLQELGGGWRNELSILGGPSGRSFDLAPSGEAFERPVTVGVREELYRGVGAGGLGWRLGIDAEGGTFDYAYDVAGFGEREEASVTRFAPAAYLEPTVQLGALTLRPGVRVDGLLVDAWTATSVDPRASARLDLGPTALFAAAGGYTQFPEVRQITAEPTLSAQRAWQYSTGVSQRLTRDLSVEVTGYTSQLRNLVVGREDAFRFFTGPPPVGPLDDGGYANEGVGRTLGIEGQLKLETDRTVAWVSATVGRSWRTDRPGEDEALFTYDQPVVVQTLATHSLPKRWRVGGRVRYGSGNPYTPVAGSYQDLGSRSYVPVYGDLDSGRLPAFWSVDLRIDKDWVYRSWTLSTYLDLQNATNRANVEVMSWNYDYSEEDPVTSLPVVPAFGVRGAW